MIKKYCVDDFNILTVLGKGLYGKVLLVREVQTQQVYALKVLKKSLVERKNKSHYVFSERNILIELSHPFIIHLHGSFQNDRKLYFLLEYCPGADLYSLLIRKEKFSEQQAKFYAAQILLALEYMHSHNVIYREYHFYQKSLKPENVLIDKDGYIRITDFGLSKKAADDAHEKFSIVGTPEYLCPEVLLKEETGKALDFWCFGSLIHEMLTGMPPFSCQNQAEMFQSIKFKPFKMEAKVSDACRSLLEGLFIKDPKTRLGFNNIDEVKKHPWFTGVSWEAVLNKQYKAPFVPIIKSNIDVSYYDSQFTELPIESYAESLATSSLATNNVFPGFSYNKPIEQKPEQQEKEETVKA